MKMLVLLMALFMVTVSTAEAKSKSRFGGIGPIRKVISAPFWVTGFVVTLVADVTLRPMYDGAMHYVYEPAIKGW